MIRVPNRPFFNTLVSRCVLGLALLCLVLVSIRIVGCVSLSEPLHIKTSGGEEDALFSIWRFAHGQPVYPDHEAIPYPVSHFNWLFYASYGTIVGIFIHAFDLDDSWIPTIARMVTLSFTMLGVATCYALQRIVFQATGARGQLTQLAWSVIAIAGPLTGFWAITARPDVAATCFELLGLVVIVTYLKSATRRTPLLLLAVALFYVAWSFKQSNVTIITGICLWLLWNRRWQDVFVLAGATWFLFAVTLLVGGEEFVFHVLQSQANQGFALSHGILILTLALMKMPLLPVPVLALCRRRYFLSDLYSRLLAATFFVSFIMACMACTKDGAADNYFFVPAALSALLVAHLLKDLTSFPRQENDQIPVSSSLTGDTMTPSLLRSLLSYSAVCAIGLMATGILAVVLGLRGRLWADRSAHQIRSILARALPDYEAPIIVLGDKYSNLPWIQRSPPHFVYRFCYVPDREAGWHFDHGGIGGLISSGYFRTIVAPVGLMCFDGAVLDDAKTVVVDEGHGFVFRTIRETP